MPPASHATVLVIDDNPTVGTALEVLFSLHDLRTLRATSPQQGLDLLRREAIDLVIQDMNFTEDTTSGEEGQALFKEIRALRPTVPNQVKIHASDQPATTPSRIAAATPGTPPPGR